MDAKIFHKTIWLIVSSLTLSSCAGFSDEVNPPTGNLIAPVLGGASGGVIAALAGASKPIIGVAAVGGAGLGYYFSTLRFAGGGIIDAGGKVFTLGQYVVIDVPTDNLFDPNTADFLENTQPILNSIVMVLSRYPQNNLIISGNTSGFGSRTFEHKLAEDRARQIASFLWQHGVETENDFMQNIATVPRGRHLIYVGYGNKFPIANDIELKGMRQNSRIQIVAYPSNEVLHWDKCATNFNEFQMS